MIGRVRTVLSGRARDRALESAFVSAEIKDRPEFVRRLRAYHREAMMHEVASIIRFLLLPPLVGVLAVAAMAWGFDRYEMTRPGYNATALVYGQLRAADKATGCDCQKGK